jgi:hypothetical protein
VSVIAVLAVLVLGVAGFAAGHIVSSLRHGPAQNTAASAAAAHGASATPVASPAFTPSVAPTRPSPAAASPKPPPEPMALSVRLAEAFGPDGVTDGDNPQVASYAIAGNAPRPWQSHWYTTAEFGMLKKGTGLLLDMGGVVTVTSVRIDLGTASGAGLELRAGGAPTMDRLREVAGVSGAGGAVRLRLAAPARARYLLVWFTQLPLDATGKYQASVYHVTVTGRP